VIGTVCKDDIRRGTLVFNEPTLSTFVTRNFITLFLCRSGEAGELKDDGGFPKFDIICLIIEKHRLSGATSIRLGPGSTWYVGDGLPGVK